MLPFVTDSFSIDLFIFQLTVKIENNLSSEDAAGDIEFEFQDDSEEEDDDGDDVSFKDNRNLIHFNTLHFDILFFNKHKEYEHIQAENCQKLSIC